MSIPFDCRDLLKTPNNISLIQTKQNANADYYSLFHLSSKVRFDAVYVDIVNYISVANLFFSIAIDLSDSERSFGGCTHL